MTALIWDQVGERRYETGIDRGVLFPPSGNVVPWNGLISVNETITRDVKSYYLDGIKYLDHYVPGSYSAKLAAFTYPDEIDALVGTEEYAPGVFLHDQRSPQLFNLTYRTRIGNDLEGPTYGYKVHILYNLLAMLNDITLNTIGSSVTPQAFEWSLSGTPSMIHGIRPTSHISLDSRLIDPTLLELIEELLYGSADMNPSLPALPDLLGMVTPVLS